MRRRNVKSEIVGIGILSAACAACSGAPESHEGSSEELVGVARAELTLVPTDAKCIQIRVVGTTTVGKLFDVVPEQNSVFDLTGLPLGSDTFSALAFGVNCSSIASATPTYVSSPATTTADVTAGTPAKVAFQMIRPTSDAGSAGVTLDFQQATHTTVEFPLNTTGSSPAYIA